MRVGAAVLALAVSAVVGCGPEGDLVEPRPDVTGPGASPELGSSPARTALAWWDGARARDSEALLGRLTPAARRTVNVENLGKALRGRFGVFAEGSEATVLYTERRPGHATVYMRIDGGALVGSVRIKGGGLMLALPLVARDDGWLIENAAWLRSQADGYVAIQRLNRRIEREAREQAQEEDEEDDE